MSVLRYFADLRPAKMVLWCYLIWYAVTVQSLFDPSPTLWINSAGISVVIGIALMLSVNKRDGAATDHWQTFRLFAMPFCVSSFSALIKGHGYLFVFPGEARLLWRSVLCCAAFVFGIFLLRWALGTRVQRVDSGA